MTTSGNEHPSAAEAAADEAAKTTLALNPLVGLQGQDLLGSATTIFQATIRRPEIALGEWFSFLGALGKIAIGSSDRATAKTDKRFADAAWKTSKPHQALLQSYFAWADAVNAYVDKIELEEHDRARARLFTDILVDGISPTNGLLTNPSALKKLVDTGGESLWSGLKNYVSDLVKNGGMPSQVDGSAFAVGKNLATTPGAVVLADPLFELLQFAPTTEQVWTRPIVITPPQINKYYSLDLLPEKSLVRFLLSEGYQVFCISWRNPKPEHRDWGLAQYVEAVDCAVDATRKITCSDDVTMMGACSGGITSCAYAAWTAGRGAPKVANLTLAVCALDPSAMDATTLGALITPTTIEAARRSSQVSGTLKGQDLAKVFAWMRPNDLIWNYWVSNYLLGNAPPAFDILFWNNDTTSLPAKLHSDYLDLITVNPFRSPGATKLSGTPIDLGKVKAETYVVAGVTDHITPWKTVYQTARLVNENATFVLSNAGHLQSLLNPPGNPKATFVTGDARSSDADAFAARATKQTGSWWTHWSQWLATRSGEKRASPASLGGDEFPPGGPAPGTYVFNA
jgi:poly[(R)-3-hydroxyalkanoate] polymerase subunit PhaC